MVFGNVNNGGNSNCNDAGDWWLTSDNDQDFLRVKIVAMKISQMIRNM